MPEAATSFQDAQELIKESLVAAPETVEETVEVSEEFEDETLDDAPELDEELSSDEITASDESESGEVIETEEIPAIEAPNSWTKDDREHFHSLPIATQERLAKQSRDRDLNTRQSQDRNAAKQKELDSELLVVRKQKADFINQLDAGAKEPSIDMLDPESGEYDPDAYHLANAKFKKNTDKIAKLSGELANFDAKELEDWQTNEIKTYQDIFPDYVDPVKGQKFRNELASYAVKVFGYTLEDAAKVFPKTPAREMLILEKARRWDAAVAKRKAGKGKLKSKSLSGGSSNPKKPIVTNMKDAAARFARSGSPADAAALLSLNKKG